MTKKEQLIEWVRKEQANGLVDIQIIPNRDRKIRSEQESEELVCAEILDIIHSPTTEDRTFF